MRVGEYLKGQNISLVTLNLVCDYLYLENIKISSKISEMQLKAFDAILNEQQFKEWLKIKRNLEHIEIKNTTNDDPNLYDSTLDDIMENDALDKSNSATKFRWGGLSGEEAEMGYWNTD